jgi:hypothetical protein
MLSALDTSTVQRDKQSVATNNQDLRADAIDIFGARPPNTAATIVDQNTAGTRFVAVHGLDD